MEAHPGPPPINKLELRSSTESFSFASEALLGLLRGAWVKNWALLGRFGARTEGLRICFTASSGGKTSEGHGKGPFAGGSLSSACGNIAQI